MKLMGKVAVVLQPSYISWLGYMAQMDQSDVFVILDIVAFDRHGWRNRNRIKTAQGIQWLTVPTSKSEVIKEVLIDNNDNWAKKHLKSIKQNYSRSKFYDMYIPIFEDIYSKQWKYLIDLDMAFILRLKEALNIKTEIEYASNLNAEGNRITKLIDICKKVGATEFLEGQAGKSYLQGEGERLFKESGINLVYQDYNHPVYPQLYGEFVSHLSVIDLLFNCGDNSLNIIRSGA